MVLESLSKFETYTALAKHIEKSGAGPRGIR